MDILILALLITLNGLISLSEMSIVASRKNRLASMAEAGDKGAAAALALANAPNRILATTQLGLIFITLLEGSFGSSAFVGQIASSMPDWIWLAPWKHHIAEATSLAAITFATLVFGEMLPKRAALGSPEAVARVMAPIANSFIACLSPLIACLSYCTDGLLSLLGLPSVRCDAVCAEDVETMLEAAGDSGLISKREAAIMDNVWRLNERMVAAVMTPRQDISFIDIGRPHQENLDILAAHPRLTLVVTHGGLDCVLGMAPISQWMSSLMLQLREGSEDPRIEWGTDLAPAHSIPNSLTLAETLESFHAHRTHVALVLNELGQVEGIASMSDLMDALVGEVPQSSDPEPSIPKDA